MPSKPTAILSTSTWTFHPLLGSPKITGVTDTSLPEVKDSVWPALLEALASFGARSIDVCHFHLSSRDPSQQRELAEACHAKAMLKNGSPDSERFERSLDLLSASGFSGPIALIGNENKLESWSHLQWMKEKISQRFELKSE